MTSAIGKMVLGILIGTVYVFVAWKLWGWFAVPVGAPHLGFVAAFGLYALAASILLWGFNVPEGQTTEYGLVLGAAKAFVALILLFEGWVAHLMIGAGFS